MNLIVPSIATWATKRAFTNGTVVHDVVVDGARVFYATLPNGQGYAGVISIDGDLIAKETANPRVAELVADRLFAMLVTAMRDAVSITRSV